MFTLNGRFLITVFGRLRGVSQAAMGGKKNVRFGAWAFRSGRRRQSRSGSMRLCKIEISNALTSEYERPGRCCCPSCGSLYRILMTAK